MDELKRRHFVALMAGLSCAPLNAFAATWKQISANAVGGGATWKAIPKTGSGAGTWKQLGSSGISTFNLTIAGNTLNYNLRAAAMAAGWNGSSAIICNLTINGGVVVGSNSIASYSIDTGGGWPAGSTITIVNNGYIAGAGGDGGYGGDTGMRAWAAYPGLAGGPALNLQFPVTINNNSGYIYSGGGGGGGAMSFNNLGAVGNSNGGGGGGAGNKIGVGAPNGNAGNGGLLAGGAGGYGGYAGYGGGYGGSGLGSAGGSGWGTINGGGGGGGGASGGGGYGGGYGGGHGLAIQRNGYAITWNSGNTRVYGGIS